MLFNPDNHINKLLQIEVNFNIGSIYIYIYSFRLNNLVWIYIPKNYFSEIS